LAVQGQAGASVRVLGSDVVSGWQSHAGAVWRAPWSDNSQQVFVDGAPLQMIGAANIAADFQITYGGGHPLIVALGDDPTDLFAGSFYVDSRGAAESRGGTLERHRHGPHLGAGRARRRQRGVATRAPDRAVG
jgi:hypothetical protein